MKNYTKQITAFAVLSLIAYSANAQSATFNWDQQNNATGTTSGMTIAPAAPGVIGDVAIDATAAPIANVVPTTSVVDPNTGVVTTTIVDQVASYGGLTNGYNNVVVTDINGAAATETVIINSEGITLNSSTTTPNTYDFDIRVTEVSTNDGLGTPTSITSTFTATAVDPAGVAIQTIPPVTGTDVADALANMEASLVGLAANNPVLGGVTTPGPAVSGGGDLNVSGNLAVGAIADVEADVTANTAKVGVTDASVAATTAVTANTAKVGVTNASVAATAAVTANTTAVQANGTAISNEVDARTALIRTVGDNADGNQIVHIGANSLVTEELDGTQRLRAEDASNNAIAIRFDGTEGVIVDNFINVTAPDAPAVFTTDSTDQGQLDPSIDVSTPTTSTIVTRLGTTTGTEVNGASGGVLIENNGNVTLSQAGGVETTVEVIQATSFLVNNADQPNPGQPVAGSQKYVAGYIDGNGQFVVISPEFTINTDLTDWIETTPLADAAYDDIRIETELAGTGGDLQVDGNANVDGVLSLGDSGNGAVTDVASAINGNTAANVLTQADVDQNEADSDAADLAIQADVDQNEFDSDTADLAIQADVDQNEFDSDAADFALGSRIDNNASAIANNSSRIASNKEDIEQNTRGIAMVAALQHTTVLPGMTNAFDLSAAHFEGETGLALNYARRINENVQINFGAASTTDFDESVIKAGIGVQW